MCADPGSYRWCHQALSRSRTSFATFTTEDCCYCQIRYNTDTAIASGTEVVVAIPKCPFVESSFQPLSLVRSTVSACCGHLSVSNRSPNVIGRPSNAARISLSSAILIRSSLQILFALLLVAAALLPRTTEANNHHSHNSNNIPGKIIGSKAHSLLIRWVVEEADSLPLISHNFEGELDGALGDM